MSAKPTKPKVRSQSADHSKKAEEMMKVCNSTCGSLNNFLEKLKNQLAGAELLEDAFKKAKSSLNTTKQLIPRKPSSVSPKKSSQMQPESRKYNSTSSQKAQYYSELCFNIRQESLLKEKVRKF